MPIKSGRYIITNVKQQNLAFLTDPNDETPLVAWYRQNNTGEQWDVKDLKNGHHSFLNVAHKRYANAKTRAKEGETVEGRDDHHQWRIQETPVRGQYTIATTDNPRFWGLVDNQKGTPVTLYNAHSDTRNWWTFKDPITGIDAEVDPRLATGRTAHDTANDLMLLQAVLFELTVPPTTMIWSLKLDLVVIQERPNGFISNATETINKICRPLLKSGRLQQSDLNIKIIEFKLESGDFHQRFSGTQNFDDLRTYQSWDFPWMVCSRRVIASCLRKAMSEMSSDAMKIIVLHLNAVPLSNGKKIAKLIKDMAMLDILLILTLGQPTRPDTLHDTDLFPILAQTASGYVLSLPSSRFSDCIVNYIENRDCSSVIDKFKPDVKIISRSIPGKDGNTGRPGRKDNQDPDDSPDSLGSGPDDVDGVGGDAEDHVDNVENDQTGDGPNNITEILEAVRGTRSVSELVHHLSSDNAQVQQAALDTLVAMTDPKIPEELHAALKSSAIPALVSLIASNDTVHTDSIILQRACCEAIKNICFWTGCREDAFSASAIPPIIRLLLHDSIQVQLAAAEALACICAYHDAARTMSIDLNAIPALVRLVDSNDSNVLDAAVRALTGISENSGGRMASVEANALPSLVRLLSSNDAKVLEDACKAIRNILFQQDDAKAAALKAGIIPPFVHLLSHNHGWVRYEAAYGLADICLYTSAPMIALKSNAIPALVRLLASKSEIGSDQREAASALTNINVLEDANMVSVKANALPVLVNLLSSNENLVPAYASAAIGSICRLKNEARAAALSADAIPPLIRILSGSYHVADKHPAAGALAHICFYGPAQVTALNLNAIPALVLLLTSDTEHMQKAAAFALANINIHSDANIVSVQANALPPLVKLLSTGPLPACQALRNICHSNKDARAAALRAGAVPPLTHLVTYGYDETRSLATEILDKIKQH